MRHALLALVVLVPAFVGCTTDGEAGVENPIEPCGSLIQDYDPNENLNPRIEFDTSNGTFLAAAYVNQVPFVAGNVLDRASEGKYDETRFHKLFPGELILGGDPNSKGPRDAWGRGVDFSLADRFHQFLRHDEPGTVSLWSPQPHAGGAQFFVTLREQPTITSAPSMDDRHPVFGRVVDGMANVTKISKTPTDQRNRPQFGAEIYSAEVLPPVDNTTERDVELSSYGFDCEEVAEPGDEAEYMVAVRNTGQGVLNGTFEASAPNGFDVELRNQGLLPLPAGQTNLYPVNVTVPENASLGSEHEIELTWSGKDANATTSVTVDLRVDELGAPATEVGTVEVHYVSTLKDARPFDTTVEAYATSDQLTWFHRAPNATEPVRLDAETGQIEGTQVQVPSGFTQLLQRAHVGETVVASVPPGSAYGTDTYGESGLGGRLLYFQVTPVAEG